MHKYIVTLVADPDEGQILFECMADDTDHAIEQAENAYPGCEINGCDSPDDDEPAPDNSPWIICPTCRGDGKHSLRFGAITQEDRERDWDPDSWDDYLSGAYDEVCTDCGGTGKVREKAWAALEERRAEYRSESLHLREY